MLQFLAVVPFLVPFKGTLAAARPCDVLRDGPYVLHQQIVNQKLIGIPKLPTDDSLPIMRFRE